MHRGYQSPPLSRRQERFGESVGQVTMEVDIPRDMAGLVIGKSGSTMRRIIKRTGADAYVDIPDVETGRTFVAVMGTVDQAQMALDEVRNLVAKVNENCARQLQGKFILQPTRDETPDVRRSDGQWGRSTFEREGQADDKWGYEDMTAHLTLSARRTLFKCLIGKNGANLKKIRRQCAAAIEVEDHRDVGENQRAFIQGGIEDVIFAAQKVKESLKWYDPRRDPREGNRKDRQASAMDLKIIRAEVAMKIKGAAAGIVIGRRGMTINKIKNATDVDLLDVDERPDKDGFKQVHIVGDVNPVLVAVSEVQNLMKDYKPRLARDDSASQASREEVVQTEVAQTDVSQTPEPPVSTPQQTLATTQPVPSMPAAPVSAQASLPLETAPVQQQFFPQAPIPQYFINQDGTATPVTWVPKGDGSFMPVSGFLQQMPPMPLNAIPPMALNATLPVPLNATPPAAPQTGVPPGFGLSQMQQPAGIANADEWLMLAQQMAATMTVQASQGPTAPTVGNAPGQMQQPQISQPCPTPDQTQEASSPEVTAPPQPSKY